jgi:hypothetical protein
VPYPFALSRNFVYFDFSPEVYAIEREAVESAALDRQPESQREASESKAEKECYVTLKNWSEIYDLCSSLNKRRRPLKGSVIIKRVI